MKSSNLRRTIAAMLPFLFSASGCTLDNEPESVDSIEQRVLTPPPQLHVVGVTSTGGIRHAVGQGSRWTGMGDVEPFAGEIGTIVDAEGAMVGSVLHIVAIAGGRLFHTIRNADGTWGRFGDLTAQLGNFGAHGSVGLAEGANGSLHVCTSTIGGAVFHTLRNPNGTWLPWGDLKVATGSNPGAFARVDCSARLIRRSGLPTVDELHFVGAIGNGQMWHAVRRTDTVWTPMGNVSAVTGASALFRDADAAVWIGELHVVGTGTNLQQHALRNSAGAWSSFGNLAPFTGDPGDEWQSSTAALDDALHVLVVTASGGLFRTTRSSTGAWSPYFNVKAATGSGEFFTRVSAAGVTPSF